MFLNKNPDITDVIVVLLIIKSTINSDPDEHL